MRAELALEQMRKEQDDWLSLEPEPPARAAAPPAMACRAGVSTSVNWRLQRKRRIDSTTRLRMNRRRRDSSLTTRSR